MRNNLLVTFLLLSIFNSCKTEESNNNIIKKDIKKEDNIENSTLPIEDTDIPFREGNGFEDRMFIYLSNKYSQVYEYKDKYSRQIIGITFSKNDSIDYYLSSENHICDTDYFGIAHSLTDNQKSVAIEKINANFKVNIYTHEEDEFLLTFITTSKFDEVKISYIDKTNLGTDCLPNEGAVMKRIKKNGFPSLSADRPGTRE